MRRWKGCLLGGLFLLAGCEKGSTPPGLLFIGKNLGSDYHITIAKGVMQEAVKHGLTVDVDGPSSESDFAYQKDSIARAVRSGKYAGVVLEPNHSVELAAAVASLSEARIPVVTVDTPVSFARDAPPYYCGFVGTDNIEGGRMAARFLAGKLASGDVVLIRGLADHQTSRDRENGFMEGIAASHPRIRIVKTLDGNWDGPTALKVYREFIATTRSHIDAVFALNDDMAVAVARFHRSGPSRPIIIGFNGGRDAQAGILGGEMTASVVQFPREMGEMAVSRLRECMHRREARDVRDELIAPKIVSRLTTLQLNAE